MNNIIIGCKIIVKKFTNRTCHRELKFVLLKIIDRCLFPDPMIARYFERSSWLVPTSEAAQSEADVTTRRMYIFLKNGRYRPNTRVCLHHGLGSCNKIWALVDACAQYCAAA